MIPKVGETISAEEFNKLPEVGETISAEEFEALPGETQDFKAFGAGKELDKPIGKITDFVAGSEKGFAKDISSVFGKQQFTPQDAALNAKTVGQLITHAHQMPMGDPRRKQLLEQASQIAGIGGTQAEETLSNLPTKTGVILNAAGVAADIATAGTYSAGMQTGKMALKTPTVLTATEKIGEKIAAPISKKVAERAEKRGIERALQNITPTPAELGTKEYAEALAKGQITPKTTFKSASVVPDKSLTETAKKYWRLLQDKDPVKNAGKVIDEIEKHDNAVGEYLQSAGIKFDKGELQKFIKSQLDGITDIMVPSAKRLQALKDDLTKTFVESVKADDLTDLWQARKQWDQVIENKLKAFGGAPTLKKDIVKTIRNSTQDFITKQLGTDVYANRMKEMRQLFDVFDNIAVKGSKEKGLSAIGAWAKANPAKAKILKGVLFSGGVLAGGYVGGRGFEALIP